MKGHQSHKTLFKKKKTTLQSAETRTQCMSKHCMCSQNVAISLHLYEPEVQRAFWYQHAELVRLVLLTFTLLMMNNTSTTMQSLNLQQSLLKSGV